MRAIAIPSKPKPGETVRGQVRVTPSTWLVPARPARPPLITIARIVEPPMLIPA